MQIEKIYFDMDGVLADFDRKRKVFQRSDAIRI